MITFIFCKGNNTLNNGDVSITHETLGFIGFGNIINGIVKMKVKTKIKHKIRKKDLFVFNVFYKNKEITLKHNIYSKEINLIDLNYHH